MKKVTELLSFLFLSSLVFFSGLFFITIHVALSQTTDGTSGTQCPAGYQWDAASNSCRFNCSSITSNTQCASRTECIWETSINQCIPRTSGGTTLAPTPPARSNGAPVGVLPTGLTQTLVTLATDKMSLCKFSTAANTPYNQMTAQFEHAANGLQHQYPLTNLHGGDHITLYVRCHSFDNGENTDDYPITFSVTSATTDTTTPPPSNNTNTNTNTNSTNGNTNVTTPPVAVPPQRSARAPQGMLPAGVTQTIVTLTTDKMSICKFGTTANMQYYQMPAQFGRSTDGLHHQYTYSNLHSGDQVSLYVRCRASDGGENNDDYPISFYIATATNEPSGSTGNTNTTPPTATVTPPPAPINTINAPTPINTNTAPLPRPANTNSVTNPEITSAPRNTNTAPTTNTAPPSRTQPPAPAQPATNVPPADVSLTDAARAESVVQLERDYAEHCRAYGINDTPTCRRFLSYNLDPECLKEKLLTPQACEDFLKLKKVSSVCASNNLAPGAACNTSVFEGYRDQIRCGDLPQDQCESITKERFLGQIISGVDQRSILTERLRPTEGRTTTREEIVQKLETNELPRDVFPLVDSTTRSLRLIASKQAIDVSNKVSVEISSPYLLMLDDDADGLPNDLETYFGTSATIADSDNDGFNDADELLSGYDPKQQGGEKRTAPIAPIATALLQNVALEEPINNGEFNSTFTVQEVITDPTTNHATLSGTATPNSLVFIYIYSKMPLVLAVQTDDSGNWVYTLQDTILDGKHTVYVGVTDDTGKLKEKSNPLAFFVNEAQAETVSSFLRDQATTPQEIRSESFIIYYIIGGGSLVLIGLAGFLLYLMKKNANT